MNKEEIEEQLKLSKRQNKDKRYDYLDSEFNAINYCIKLEKYTNKVLQENKKLKKENKQLEEDILFCLVSINQEMEMSTDSRTRNEMTTCFEILQRWNK